VRDGVPSSAPPSTLAHLVPLCQANICPLAGDRCQHLDGLIRVSLRRQIHTTVCARSLPDRPVS